MAKTVTIRRPNQAQGRDQRATQPPVSHRGEHTQRQGDRERDGAGEQRQRPTDGELLEDVRADRRPGEQGGPEIASEQTPDPHQVALPGRLVETHLLAQGMQRLRRRVGAQNHRRRVARQNVDHGEHEHRGCRQADQKDGQSGRDLDRHQRTAFMPLLW
jgi:hypothetical protein